MYSSLSNIIFKQQKNHMEQSFHVGIFPITIQQLLYELPAQYILVPLSLEFSNSHRLDFSCLQKFIGGVHTAVQHIGNFFRGYQGVVIIKHNGQSSFDGLLYCCRMSNHTRYKERATTQVIALFCA